MLSEVWILTIVSGGDKRILGAYADENDARERRRKLQDDIGPALNIYAWVELTAHPVL